MPHVPRSVLALWVYLVGVVVVTAACERWVGVPYSSLVGVDPSVRLGFLWQWATHVLAEPLTDSVVLWMLVSAMVVHSVVPSIESLGGRRALGLALAAGVLGAGVPTTLVAYGLSAVRPGLGPIAPVTGSASIVLALLAHFAILAGDRAQFSLLPTATGPTLSGRAMVGLLVGLETLALVVNRMPYHALAGYGAIAAGALSVRWQRPPQRPSGPTRRGDGRASHLRVVGGEGPRMLHRLLASLG